MKFIVFNIIFLTGFYLHSFSQTIDNVSFVNTEMKSGYIFIPTSVFEDTVSALLVQDIRASKFPSLEISIYWNAGCIDGAYYLVITPEQLYLRSGHNNPNPNFIFWQISIDSVQYLQIKKGLKLKTLKGFSKSKIENSYDSQYYYDNTYKENNAPENLNDSTGNVYWNYCLSKLGEQLKKCFKLINSFIIEENRKIIPILSRKSKHQNWKYIGAKEEILDWLPYKKGTIIQ